MKKNEIIKFKFMGRDIPYTVILLTNENNIKKSVDILALRLRLKCYNNDNNFKLFSYSLDRFSALSSQPNLT